MLASYRELYDRIPYVPFLGNLTINLADVNYAFLLSSPLGQTGNCILHAHTVNYHTVLKNYIVISSFAASLRSHNVYTVVTSCIPCGISAPPPP